MIVTCTSSGSVRPRLIQHELLVVVADDFRLYVIQACEARQG